MVSPQGDPFGELCAGKGESGAAGRIVRGVAGRQLPKPRGQLVTTITICCEDLDYLLSSSLRRAQQPKGEFAVTGSTLTRRHGRLLISRLPLVVLFTMASTMGNSQGISKPTSVTPQPKVNAGAPPPGNDLPAQQTIRTDASRNNSNGPKSSGRADNNPNRSAGATTIEATQGTFRFDTGSQGKRYHIKTPYGGLDVGG
jgi:hypothetical protein